MAATACGYLLSANVYMPMPGTLACAVRTSCPITCLEGPQEILEKTYSNCTWQNETLGSAKAVAQGNKGDLVNLGLRLGLSGYPAEITSNSDIIKKTALQYIESQITPALSATLAWPAVTMTCWAKETAAYGTRCSFT
ncbi:MAG: hypothetical protein M3A44_08740 [Gammaproteobacteria bacterium]